MNARRATLALAGLALLGGLALMRATAVAIPGSEAHGARWTASQPIAPGENQEYPDITVDGYGQGWSSWISLIDRQEHVFFRSWHGTEPGAPQDIGLTSGLQFSPRIIASRERVWVVWSARSDSPSADDHWQLMAREIHDGVPGNLDVISSSSEDALRPALGLDEEGAPWVAWESRVGNRFRVMARKLVSGVGGPPALEVGTEGELNLRPAVTAAPGGGVFVAWDQYGAGEYQVYARKVGESVGPAIRVSDEPATNVDASAATDGSGRVWIAYATNADDRGGQRVGKTLRVKVLVDGKVRELAGGAPPVIETAPGRLDAVEFPSIAFDAEGRLWVFARRGQGWIAFRYEGARWREPIDLSEGGWGGRGRQLRAALGPEGFHLVARRLHLLSHQLFTAPLQPARQPALAGDPEPTGARAMAAGSAATPAPARPGAASAPAGSGAGAPTSTPADASTNTPTDAANAASGTATGTAINTPTDAANGASVAATGAPVTAAGAPATTVTTGKKARAPQVTTSRRGGKGHSSRGQASRSGSHATSRKIASRRSSPRVRIPAATPTRVAPVAAGVVLPDGVGNPRPALPSSRNYPRVLDEGPLPPHPAGYYFGDLHTHTWMSDGAGDPDEVYTRSRDRYRFDFVALTDHDNENGNRLLPSEWTYLKLLAEFFNQPGKFVTFEAYEWTSLAYPKGAGHRNVYFPGIDAPLFNSADEAADTKTLFELLKAQGAISSPHHIGWTGTDWENHDPEVQRAVEIVSVHGAFEKPGNRPILPRAELAGMFVRDGLLRQLKFGLVGGSDGHGFPWHYGVSRKEDVWRTGLTGLIAPALNRSALYAALKNRQSIATSGAAILIRMTVNGEPIGSELSVDRGPTFDIHVEGTAPLKDVTLVRDGEDILNIVSPGKVLEREVNDDPSPGQHFYYLRVVQSNAEAAWASPVWVDLKGRILVGPPDP